MFFNLNLFILIGGYFTTLYWFCILNLIYSSFSVFFQLNSRGLLDEIKPCSSIKGQSWFSCFREIIFLLNVMNEFVKCAIIYKLMLVFHLGQRSIFLSSLLGCWLNEYFALLRVEVDSINKTHWLFKSPLLCTPVPINHTEVAYQSSSWLW